MPAPITMTRRSRGVLMVSPGAFPSCPPAYPESISPGRIGPSGTRVPRAGRATHLLSWHGRFRRQDSLRRTGVQRSGKRDLVAVRALGRPRWATRQPGPHPGRGGVGSDEDPGNRGRGQRTSRPTPGPDGSRRGRPHQVTGPEPRARPQADRTTPSGGTGGEARPAPDEARKGSRPASPDRQEAEVPTEVGPPTGLAGGIGAGGAVVGETGGAGAGPRGRGAEGAGAGAGAGAAGAGGTGTGAGAGNRRRNRRGRRAFSPRCR